PGHGHSRHRAVRELPRRRSARRARPEATEELMTEITLEPTANLRPGGEPVLEVENLEVTFATEEGVVQAVRGVHLEVFDHEVLGIVGESGSGKSVTMLAVMGLLPNTATVTGSARFR